MVFFIPKSLHAPQTQDAVNAKKSDGTQHANEAQKTIAKENSTNSHLKDISSPVYFPQGVT